MKRKTVVTCLSIIFCSIAIAQKKVQLASPDGSIVFSFSFQKNKACYSVAYNKQTLIQNSSLNFFNDFRNGPLPIIINPSEIYMAVLPGNARQRYPAAIKLPPIKIDLV